MKPGTSSKSTVVRTQLQAWLPLFFLAAAMWVGFGRALFGAGGWLTLITFLMWMPAIFVFGLVVGVITSIRYKKTGYVFSKLVSRLYIALFAALFILGFTLVDGGDTEESVGSLLTKLLGVNYATVPDGGVIGSISEQVAQFSLSVIPVLGIILFILSFTDKKNRQ